MGKEVGALLGAVLAPEDGSELGLRLALDDALGPEVGPIRSCAGLRPRNQSGNQRADTVARGRNSAGFGVDEGAVVCVSDSSDNGEVVSTTVGLDDGPDEGSLEATAHVTADRTLDGTELGPELGYGIQIGLCARVELGGGRQETLCGARKRSDVGPRVGTADG